MKQRKIAITSCGDIALGGGVEAHYVTNNSPPMETALLQFLQKTDVFIGNLECPLTDNPTPQWYHFKTLKASTICGEMLKTLGLDAVSLANNHIADYGKRGLKDTIDVLDRLEIPWGGAGFSKKEAEQPIVLSREGYRIGIMNLAQPEISALSALGWGAAVLEGGSAVRQMRQLARNTDIAIGFLHLGVEFFNYPTPRQIELCRELIKAGARIVVCHHPHVPQGYETYEGGVIAYGLGNFLFDMKPIESTGSRLGAVLRVVFEDLELRSFKMLPVETANGYTRMLGPAQKDSAAALLKQLSDSLQNPVELLKHDYFTCRDNLMIHLRAFLFFGLLKKNKLKMYDLIRQQRWHQIFELRKRLLTYLFSGAAIKNENEKSPYPKTIEGFIWRVFCLASGLIGRLFRLNIFVHLKNRS